MSSPEFKYLDKNRKIPSAGRDPIGTWQLEIGFYLHHFRPAPPPNDAEYNQRQYDDEGDEVPVGGLLLVLGLFTDEDIVELLVVGGDLVIARHLVPKQSNEIAALR